MTSWLLGLVETDAHPSDAEDGKLGKTGKRRVSGSGQKKTGGCDPSILRSLKCIAIPVRYRQGFPLIQRRLHTIGYGRILVLSEGCLPVALYNSVRTGGATGGMRETGTGARHRAQRLSPGWMKPSRQTFVSRMRRVPAGGRALHMSLPFVHTVGDERMSCLPVWREDFPDVPRASRFRRDDPSSHPPCPGWIPIA